MKKQYSFKREALHFKQFSRKGYSLFACLGREVLIGTLSVATLTYAKADGISTQTEKVDTTAVAKTSREVMLEDVEVTGSRAPLTRSQAARMVTVLDRQQIEQAPVQSVNDLLKYAAAVDVRQRGPLGAQTDISIRGGNYEQVTILLNGINICDPQTGHNAFDYPVDISEIERIEVLEGPAGRVVGTSSLLGAINIVTRMPRQSSVSAHAEGGSFGYLSGGGRANVASGRWNNQLSGSYTRSDGFSRNAKGGLNEDFRQAKAFYQGSFSDDDVAVRWHAGVSAKDWGSSNFYGKPVWDDQYEHTLKTYTALQADTRRGSLHLRPQIYWNHSEDRFELFRGNPDAYPYNYHRSDVFGVNLNGYVEWLLGKTAFGAEMRNEDLVSGNLGDPLDNPKAISGTNRYYDHGINRTNIQFVLEHNILLERFTLSAGLVAVKNTWADMGVRVYPGLDMSYRFNDHWKVYASYNTSLRMPSVTELYYSVGGHQADKHLKPEELSALETGVKYASRGINGSASLFHNHQKNLIDWVLDTREGPDAVARSVNFGTINAMGVEANAGFDFQQLMPAQKVLKSLNVGWHCIYQDKNEEQGVVSQYVLEYVKNKVVANVQLNIWRQLQLGLNYRLVHRNGSYTTAQGGLERYGTYQLLDGRLSWTEREWNVYVEGNNLLDKTYHDFGSLAEPGFWLIAGAAININL